MSRTVLLPRDLAQRLGSLTVFNQEVEGILLYRRNGNYCPVETIFMTGVGT